MSSLPHNVAVHSNKLSSLGKADAAGSEAIMMPISSCCNLYRRKKQHGDFSSAKSLESNEAQAWVSPSWRNFAQDLASHEQAKFRRGPEISTSRRRDNWPAHACRKIPITGSLFAPSFCSRHLYPFITDTIQSFDTAYIRDDTSATFP